MDNDNNIPDEFFPVTFNPYKHHLGYLRMKIENWKGKPWIEVKQEIMYIGNNLIDLYYGQLTVKGIYDEILDFAWKNDLISPGKLAAWLKPVAYKKILLSDHSTWVIKQGKDSIYFLHIHPGKYSPFTIRVKAPTLKTVITLQIFNLNIEETDLKTVNQIRIEKLNLSPVKALVAGKGIYKLWAGFNSL